MGQTSIICAILYWIWEAPLNSKCEYCTYKCGCFRDCQLHVIEIWNDISRVFNDSRNNRPPRYLKGKVWEEVPDSERKPPGSSWEIGPQVMDVSSLFIPYYPEVFQYFLVWMRLLPSRRKEPGTGGTEMQTPWGNLSVLVFGVNLSGWLSWTNMNERWIW